MADFEIIPIETFHTLMQFAGENQLEELSISTPEGKFSVRRGPVAPVSNTLIENLPIAIERVESKFDVDEGNLVKVVSPLAGVFYRASSPGSQPFVEEGDPVEPGDPLCIVEAMKVMNEIISEVKGAVEKVLPGNGEVVEEGEVLFLIRIGGQGAQE